MRQSDTWYSAVRATLWRLAAGLALAAEIEILQNLAFPPFSCGSQLQSTATSRSSLECWMVFEHAYSANTLLTNASVHTISRALPQQHERTPDGALPADVAAHVVVDFWQAVTLLLPLLKLRLACALPLLLLLLLLLLCQVVACTGKGRHNRGYVSGIIDAGTFH